MSSKRRGAAAPISPEVRSRNQKRRKVSDDDPVVPEETNRTSSEPGEAEANESDASQGEESGSEVEFEGDSIQMAQDKILTELFRLKDEDGEEVAYPFVGKPDRNAYRDYYEIIQHPVSLRSIQKKVRGTDGRKKGTKMTAFPTWQSFEEEVSYLWRNAREYNEDGSEISALAGVMEDYFKQRVTEAKRLVPDSIQTSVATDDKPPGVTVDDDSFTRQQELIHTGSTSQEADMHQGSPQTRSLRRQIESPKSSSGSTQTAAERSYGGTSVRDVSSVIKSETPTASSHRADLRTSSVAQNGHSVDSTNGTTSQDVSTHLSPEKSPMDSLWRRAGQDVASALLRNTQILTHPSLSLKKGFCLDIPPSSTLSQQTITISLPPSHHLLTVRPTLASSTAQRQVKMIAQLGMQRLHPAGDASMLAYDIQLHPGITRVDLEAIAGPARGAPKSGPPGSEVDYERVTIFFNLLR